MLRVDVPSLSLRLNRGSSVEPWTATIDADGTCRYLDDDDDLNEVEISWPSVAAWAQAWIAEQRSDDSVGPAWHFIDYATDGAIAGVVDVLGELARRVADDEELLIMVGVGPLRDLLNYSRNGPRVADDVERVAAQNAAFRRALRLVTLSDDLPAAVRERFTALGVGAG